MPPRLSLANAFSKLNASQRAYHPPLGGYCGFSAELPSGTAFIHQWEPQSHTRRGTLLFVHGLNDHGARFEPHIEHYHEIGLTVVALDLAGHGKAGGTRGMLPSFPRCVSDVVATALALVNHQPEQPIFFMGASLGAVLALEAALAMQAADPTTQHSTPVFGAPLSPEVFNVELRRSAYEIVHRQSSGTSGIPSSFSTKTIHPTPGASAKGAVSGVIVHAPVGLVHLSAASNQLLCGVARAAAGVMPWLPVYKLQRGLSYPGSIRQERLDEDLADPLYYRGVMHAATAASILTARERMALYCAQGLPLHLPLLIQHGSADELCNVEGSHQLHAAAGGDARNATLHVIPGAHHDLLREREDVVQAAREVNIAWLKKELQRKFQT